MFHHDLTSVIDWALNVKTLTCSWRVQSWVTVCKKKKKKAKQNKIEGKKMKKRSTGRILGKTLWSPLPQFTRLWMKTSEDTMQLQEQQGTLHWQQWKWFHTQASHPDLLDGLTSSSQETSLPPQKKKKKRQKKRVSFLKVHCASSYPSEATDPAKDLAFISSCPVLRTWLLSHYVLF